MMIEIEELLLARRVSREDEIIFVTILVSSIM